MLRRLIGGASRIGMWLLSGARPVSRFLASQRAATCAACPMNLLAGKLGFASVVGGALAKAMGMKGPPGVRGKLGTCAGCGCNLTLKVWVPLRGDEDASALHPGCWVGRGRE